MSHAESSAPGWGAHSIHEIEGAVAARYGLSRAQMRGLDRTRAVARPRQIAMTLAREMTGLSLPRIGRHFCRDHTTVIHALRAIARLTGEDSGFAAEVEGCRELIARQTPWKARVAAMLQQRGLAG